MKRIVVLVLALTLVLCPACLARENVAGSDDMTDVIDIVPQDAVPVYASSLVDGEYEIDLSVSSAMFKVEKCFLTVSEGEMTARLCMKSKAYSHMYPGSAEDAAALGLDSTVALEESEDGVLSFTLPVEALDAGYECAAYSARKQLWYPRMIVFHADTLPLEAWNPEELVTAASLGLEDGQYTCGVVLEGEGRAKLNSPAVLTVKDGACEAHITFSTSKIDYVLVGGEKYEPVSTEGGAALDVPAADFDKKLTIICDSTAILPAVEVRYTMTFDSATLEKES